MTETVITGVASFVFGGGLSILSYLKFFQDRKKDNLTFIEEELKRYKQAYEDLRIEVDKLKLAMVPSPVPEWRKDIWGRYVYVSPNYELLILLPLELTGVDVIGKTDVEVFADYPDFAKTLRDIDDEARISLKKFAIRRNIPFPGHAMTLMVIKEISQNIDGQTYFTGRCYIENETET